MENNFNHDITTVFVWMLVICVQLNDRFEESVIITHYELQIGQYRSSEFSISKILFFSHAKKI